MEEARRGAARRGAEGRRQTLRCDRGTEERPQDTHLTPDMLTDRPVDKNEDLFCTVRLIIKASNIGLRESYRLYEIYIILWIMFRQLNDRKLV